MGSDTALLVIDMQVGNFDVSEPVHGGDALLAAIGGLIDRARAAGVAVIYVQHSGGDGAPDEPGTPGWAIHPAIAPAGGDTVVHKRNPDAFQGTNLQAVLEAGEIGKLVVVGIQTEYCVDTTCRRAYSLGYEVTLVADGHSTWDGDALTTEQIIAHHNDVLGGWFVTLKAADKVEF